VENKTERGQRCENKKTRLSTCVYYFDQSSLNVQVIFLLDIICFFNLVLFAAEIVTKTVDEFLGIPYATPPTGDHRFRVSVVCLYYQTLRNKCIIVIKTVIKLKS